MRACTGVTEVLRGLGTCVLCRRAGARARERKRHTERERQRGKTGSEAARAAGPPRAGRQGRPSQAAGLRGFPGRAATTAGTVDAGARAIAHSARLGGIGGAAGARTPALEAPWRARLVRGVLGNRGAATHGAESGRSSWGQCGMWEWRSGGRRVCTSPCKMRGRAPRGVASTSARAGKCLCRCARGLAPQLRRAPCTAWNASGCTTAPKRLFPAPQKAPPARGGPREAAGAVAAERASAGREQVGHRRRRRRHAQTRPRSLG